MSDIFLSYASEDRLTAERLADALQVRGWSVWWDRQVPTGQTFDGMIEAALGQARCVIVLWSKASVSSDWVKAEAGEGRARRILLPALIEDVAPPLEFRRIQAVRLIDWLGASAHPGLDRLVRDVATILDQPPAPPAPSPSPPYATFALVILPSVIVFLLASVLMNWRVPTAIRLEVVVNRAEFTVAATDAPLTRIFDRVAFRSITVERFAAVSFEPGVVQVADPTQYRLADDRYPDTAWRNVASSGAMIQFRPFDDMRLPSVTIQPAGGGGAGLATLSPINVPARSRITLEIAGDRTRTVTVKLAHRDPLLILPVPEQIQLTAAQTSVSGLSEPPSPGRQAMTFRFERREGGLALEIRGNAESLVFSVRVSPASSEQSVALFSDGAFPIDAIDFTRLDGLGNRVSAVAADSQLSYPDNPAAAPLRLLAADLIGLDRLQRFRVRRIVLEQPRPGLRFELEGVAGHIATSTGYRARDHRLTAFQALTRRPAWLVLGLLAWAIPTAVGAYRLTARRRSRKEDRA
jgi:hypothetical protein